MAVSAAPATLGRRLAGLVRLLRPLNVLMMLAGVAVGGLLAAGPAAFGPEARAALVLAMGSAALIGAGSNAINDVFDLGIDRVNRPERPLASGLLTVRAARTVWVGTSALGIGLAAFLSAWHLGIAAGSVALLYAYSAALKRRPLAGNVAVALVLGLALLYGGLAVASVVPAPLGLGAAFAFGTALAREVAKDIEDAAGDAVEGARTLPLVVGSGPAAWVAAGAAGLTVALMPLALPAGLGSAFLALVLPATALLLAAVWVLLGTDVAPPEALDALSEAPGVAARAGRASVLLKAAMLAGLLALALA